MNLTEKLMVTMAMLILIGAFALIWGPYPTLPKWVRNGLYIIGGLCLTAAVASIFVLIWVPIP